MDFSGDDWRGRVGKGWATEWERTDRSFAGLTGQLVDAAIAALPTGSGDRLHFLDIGCGAGETTIALADARPNADATGLDLSADLVAVAQDRASGRINCHFVEGDATAWRGDVPFDAALSRHGVMFFSDPVAAFAHLRSLMKPGAPLVFSCFRDRSENLWASEATRLLNTPPPTDPDAPGPFAFANVARVTSIMNLAGWHDIRPTPVDFAYVAGAGEDPVADALSYFSRIGPAAPLIAAMPDQERTVFRTRFAEVLAAQVKDGVVSFPAAAWIWQAQA
ncbi:MAG: class I SAM-dependent methyltransferase [Sphingomonadales bacterium]